MNINDFERRIDAVIVDRGYDYYLAGNIVEVYKLEDYEYIFEVEGNEVYEVIVKIDKKMGKYCILIVTVLMILDQSASIKWLPTSN
ncbi:hypothetical protein GCM10020331_091040 [Ectobacillus funiculus]